MSNHIYTTDITVMNEHLDSFGHVNNAVYLQLFEQARWDIINKNGYGIDKIQDTGLGPTILKIEITFTKELRLHDHIIIETRMLPYRKKIGGVHQQMLRNGEVVCEATYTMGLFCLKKRKLVLPTPEWLRALGLD